MHMSNDTKHIVVIDDEKYICNIIAEALSEFKNYKLRKFTDPEKAMEYISSNSVDLVLTDLVMGDFSGVQILEHVLKYHADAVVVLMTGYPTVKTAISVLKKGGYDYLIKPFKLDDLKSTIKRGLDNQQIKRENVELRGQLELLKIADEISAGIKMTQLLKLIVNTAVKVLPDSSATILLKARKSGHFRLKCMAGKHKAKSIEKFLKGEDTKRKDDSDYKLPWSLNEEINNSSTKSMRSYISYPLISKDEIVGMLNLVYTNPFSFISPGQKRMISLLVSYAANAVESNYLDKNLRKSYFQTIKTLANAIEARDRYTAGHTDRVYRLAKIIGGEMGWNKKKLAELRTGCILHDIGKIGVPDSVLNKPDRLNDYERNIMMKHPELGVKMLQGIPFLKPATPYIIAHHEMFDGSGYPNGLKGEDIPIEGRLLAVVDTYDAITSDRPYRDRRDPQIA
ncbi:MAG: response regulator, partial [candidate division Zixibacteria bacterium]|nr:response regulator [candidate division Zixibacteria bacterium]